MPNTEINELGFKYEHSEQFLKKKKKKKKKDAKHVFIFTRPKWMQVLMILLHWTSFF